MRVRVHKHTWVRVWEGQRTTYLAVLQKHLTLCFESGALIGLGLADSVRLAGQGASGT